MDAVSVLRPTRQKGIVSGILYLPVAAYSLLLDYGWRCMSKRICDDAPHHTVPNRFPGASCAQVCADTPELVVGYIGWSFMYFILPFLCIYLFSGVVLHLLDRDA